MFKKILLSLSVPAIIVAGIMTGFKKLPVEQSPVSTATPSAHTVPGFAIVELFTSEGCSSCPSADAAVAELDKKYPDNVYVLGFHVDYWDRLGWKDVFSNAAYSDRQRHYAGVFGLDGIYTPQVVVNGTREFVGSDKGTLKKAVEEVLKQTPLSSVELSASVAGNGTIEVTYAVPSAAGNNLLNIALVQLHAQTSIQRGENEGRTLHHANIVRDLKTITPADNGKGKISLAAPAGFAGSQYRVIAWLQDREHLKVSGAMRVPIQ
jgi:hypothetical protein